MKTIIPETSCYEAIRRMDSAPCCPRFDLYFEGWLSGRMYLLDYNLSSQEVLAAIKAHAPANHDWITKWISE